MKSGSGKTTLLSIIAALSTPRRAGFGWGERLDPLPPFKSHVKAVFQNYEFFPCFTVEENISYGLRVREWRGRRSLRALSRLWRGCA